jgi:hypothetical protein
LVSGRTKKAQIAPSPEMMMKTYDFPENVSESHFFDARWVLRGGRKMGELTRKNFHPMFANAVAVAWR